MRAARRWPRVLLLCCLAAALAAAQESDPPEPLLGRGAAIAVPRPTEESPIAVAAGTPLRAAPDPRSPALAVIDIAVELEALERRGDWGKVRFGDWSGWVPLTGAGAAGGTEPPPAPPPASAGGAPGAPRPGPDPERLRRARELLGEAGEPERIGPFELYTDLPAGRVLERYRVITGELAGAYAERYGLAPGIESPLAVVLYRREAQYRAYEEAETGLAGLGAMGHAGYGIAALFVGGRRPEAVEPLLIHELTHLANRATLGVGSPPWLEEGLANDLAFSRVRKDGSLELGSLGGRSWVSDDLAPQAGGGYRVQRTLHTQGPVASAGLLIRRARQRRLMPLAQLTDLTWGEFARPEEREMRYVHSAFFVRFLLDGGRDDLGRGFRAFLAAVAAGAPAHPERLLADLGSDWEALESGFRRWLGAFAAAP